MMPNIKTHLKGMGKLAYVYMLAVALSWVAFPVIVICLQQYAQIYVVISVYTFFVTLILIAMLYITMHGFGEADRKPYGWARYNTKGFVCALMMFAAVLLAEEIIILLADQYIIVKHPFLTIESLNHYAKLVIYMPFMWFYRIISPPTEVSVVPDITWSTAFFPGIIILLASGIGYIMGYHGIRIIKNPPKAAALRKFLYGGPRKSKKKKPIPKEDAK
ncbi:MAG: hypothetical protein E7387_02565 [Ruminococcaceae bacterium]|nr:hypothetical protein [Oscillospiraceae bacterium]